MEDLRLFFEAVFQVFRCEFTLYGFTFSFWEVFAFSFVASVVCWIIHELFLGG